MGTKVWPIALFILLLLAFVGWWFSLAARMTKTVIDQRSTIVLEMQVPPSAKNNPEALKALQAKAVTVAQNRLRLMFDKTPVVAMLKGNTSIAIKLPQAIEAKEVRDLLTSEGRVQLFWAKNLVTDINSKRRYTSSSSADEKEITFGDLFELDKKQFRFGSPEYAKMLEGWVQILDSDDVQSAEPMAYNGGICPTMRFSSQGAVELESWCRKYSREHENLAFAVDGRVINIAPLKEGTILTDSAYIQGKFEDKYVRRLCAQIGGGRLPVKLIESKPAR